MRVILYGRLSRVIGGGLSENIDIQLEEGRAYAAEEGWQVVAELSDNDISASKYSKKPRLGYQQALELIRANRADGIVITEMSRLYRRLEELLELIHMAEYTDLRAIATTDGSGYDLSTGEGIHNAVSAVNNAVLESRRLSDRVRRKKKAHARQGRFNGGRRPYGYEADGVTVREHEAEIIREVVRRILNGEALWTIVIDLNQRGILTSTGKAWHPATVREMLKSKRLLGIRTHHGVEYPAEWPAVVTAEDWDQVQLILQANRERRRASNPNPRKYLLTGWVECGICHQSMIGSNHQERGRNIARYRCFKEDSRAMAHGCGKLYRTADPVDALVAEAVLYRLDSPELASAFSGAEQGTELQDLLATYSAKKLKLKDLVKDYASGLLNREQLAEAKSIVEEALEETRAKLDRLTSGRTLTAIPAGQTIREAWDVADTYWRRNLIGLVVERVILHPGHPGKRRWKHEPTGREWRFDPSSVDIVWKV
jgi:DNA invertase Pin-like site-specific DNA recombinase